MKKYICLILTSACILLAGAAEVKTLKSVISKDVDDGLKAITSAIHSTKDLREQELLADMYRVWCKSKITDYQHAVGVDIKDKPFTFDSSFNVSN